MFSRSNVQRALVASTAVLIKLKRMDQVARCGLPVACFLLLAAVSAPLHATILSYGGDPFFVTGTTYAGFNDEDSTEGFYAETYGNFTVPVGQVWTITSVFAQIGDPDPNTPHPLANWDIRTGMSASSLGTSVASGTSTNSTTTWVSFAEQINGDPTFTLTVKLAAPVILVGGKTYYLNVLPLESSDFNMFVGLGHGTNTVGTQIETAYYTLSQFPGQVSSIADYVSVGVAGIQSPEPGTFPLAGGMLAALVLLQRRHKMRKKA
jgi:hypothetical protein